MKHSRENIQLLASIGIQSYSDDELPVITPCSAPCSSSNLNGDSIPSSQNKIFPSIKVYSEQDGTYIGFHIKSPETSVADLKNFIGSLRDAKWTHHSSIESQASTIDSELDSNQTKKKADISLFEQNIQIYGVIPGQPKRIFSNSDTILKAIREIDNLKLYYSNESFENKRESHNGLIVTVYPKANLYEFGIKCLTTISESGLKFIPEEGDQSSKRIILISFDDICSISVYKNVENCLLIKRKTMGKNPFLIQTTSSIDFTIMKKELKRVSEIQKDLKHISDADSRLSNSSLNLNNTESLTKMNSLAIFYEFITSDFGKIFFCKWIKSIGQDIEQFPELKALCESSENDLSKLVSFTQIKKALLNQDYSSLCMDTRFIDLTVKFERYVREVSPPLEDILKVN